MGAKATDTRIRTTPTMRAMLVAGLSDKFGIVLPASDPNWSSKGSALKGLKARGYVVDGPGEIPGYVWPVLTSAGREKALAIVAATNLAGAAPVLDSW